MKVTLAGQDFELSYVWDRLPDESELARAAQQLMLGMIPTLIIDEHRRVLGGTEFLLAALRQGLKDLPCLVYPYRSEAAKKEMVQQLRPSSSDPPTEAADPTAIITLSRSTFETWAKSKVRPSTPAPRTSRLGVMVPSLKHLPKVLEVLAALTAEALPNKQLTAKRLMRLKRESDTRRLKALPPATVQQGTVRLLCGDFQTRSQEIADASIPLVLSDPPYGQDFLSQLDDFGRVAQRILQPSGLLIFYYGNQHLFSAQKLVGEHLIPLFIMPLIHRDQHAVCWNTRTINRWKPILVFQKPPRKAYWPLVQDLIQGGGQEQDLHPWQQNLSESEYLIQTFCPPQGTVVDLCMGSGTVILAARRLAHRGINALGIEQDPVTFQVAEQRIFHDDNFQKGA